MTDRPSVSPARFLWRMRPYFRQVAGELVLGSLCGIVMNTAVVLPALLLGHAVDEVVALSRGQSSPAAVAMAALLYVLGTLATELPRIGKRWWLMTANARIRTSIRADAFRGVLGWAMPDLVRTPIGNLMARIVGDVEVLGVGVREFTIEMWDTVLFSLSFVAAMLWFDVGLTLLALLPVPIALVLAHATGRWVAGRTTASREVNAQLTAAIQEQLAGVRVLRVFGRTAAAVERVAVLSNAQAQANLALVRFRAGLQPVYSTLMTAGIVFVVWLGGQHVASGAMTVGAFVAYLELFGRFVARAYRIPQLVNSVQSGAAAYTRIEPLLAPPLEFAGEKPFASFQPGHLVGLTAPTRHAPVCSGAPSTIAIRDASFTYPGAETPAFSNLWLEVRAGSFVAITGPVASGKSALARCLAGLYAPQSGEILIDGIAACAVERGRVGYAPQEGFLFSGSVADNVFLDTQPGDTDSRGLKTLLALAALDQDVASLPLGADTPIGDRGVRISGGQRQRLGLARAAAAQAPASPGLLVLDDPFSAVDVGTESQIVANVRQTFGAGAPPRQRSTVMLFSHRLGAFPQADVVLVLDGGRIVERGTHVELIAAGGVYARIYHAQQRVEDGAAATPGAR